MHDQPPAAPTVTATDGLPRRVDTARRFNRFYTKQIGLLDEGLLGSAFSLTEARVLFEIAHHPDITAKQLGSALGLDPGYLSRMLKKFERHELIERRPSHADGRHRVISLTSPGRQAFADLNLRSHAMLEQVLLRLSEADQEQLVKAMAVIQELLEPDTPSPAKTLVLRPHRPGDLGWATYRHGVLYFQEYGWDATFEALVGVILGEFVQHFDARREASWIAELDGRFAGCVFLVKEDDAVARLRCLLVEPAARGHGVGTRLVDECVRFAQGAGYKKITLWTNDVLHAARRIYQRAGFVLVKEEPHRSFGHDLVGQTWDLDLAQARLST